MHEPVDAVPSLAGLLHRFGDVRRFRHIHLENFRDRIELLGRHLRDAHHPAEAREEELSAGALRLLRDRVTDGAAVAHAGDEDLLACEDHLGIVIPLPGSLPVATGRSRLDHSLQEPAYSLASGSPATLIA